MSQIAFILLSGVILLQVGEGRQRPAMVEGMRAIRNQHQQRTIWFEYATKLFERSKWIGNVFENMRGKQEVIGTVADRGEIGASWMYCIPGSPSGRY